MCVYACVCLKEAKGGGNQYLLWCAAQYSEHIMIAVFLSVLLATVHLDPTQSVKSDSIGCQSCHVDQSCHNFIRVIALIHQVHHECSSPLTNIMDDGFLNTFHALEDYSGTASLFNGIFQSCPQWLQRTFYN